MDGMTDQVGPGGGPQDPAPQGTVIPMADEWAAGVHPVAISPRSRRFRWGMAGAIVVVVALATTAGAFVLSGAAGSRSLTAAMAPKNSVFFMEVRTDLPGDQRANLAGFLSHFPGFKDRAQFDNALDEVLNKLTSEVSPDLRYTSAFKPWMEGEVSIALTSLGLYTTASSTPVVVYAAPSATSNLPDLPAHSAPGAVAIFALKDRSAAQVWVNAELSRLNVKTTSLGYAGTTLYTTGSGIDQGAYALTDQDLLLGTVAGVKAALDTRTAGSLADNPNYQAAMKSLTGDSLARFYVGMRQLVQSGLVSTGSSMSGIVGALGVPLPSGFDIAAIPAWLAGSIRAESDRTVLEMAIPKTGTTSSDNHTSRIASSLPGNTVGVFEIHSLGRALSSGLAAVASAGPAAGIDSGTIGTVKQALSLIGGVDWIGDGTAVVTATGPTFDGGIVAEATDAGTAQSKVDTIGNLVSLSSIVTGYKRHDETYNGHRITTVTVSASSGLPELRVSFAAKDNLIVVGYTDAFVKAVIDTTPASSLASQADYSSAMSAAGASNEESFYVNVSALEDQIGRAVLSSNPSRWTLDYKPYFDHLGGIAFAVIDGTTVNLRLVVTAR